jgi:hypothetical protein
MIGNAAGPVGAVDHIDDVDEVNDVAELDELDGVNSFNDIGAFDDIGDADEIWDSDGTGDSDGIDAGADCATDAAPDVTITLRGAERALSSTAPPPMNVASSSVCGPLDSGGSLAAQAKSAGDDDCVQEAPPSSDLEPST